MELHGNDYHISYDPQSATVTFRGILELGGVVEYAPIAALLNNIAQEQPPIITLNVRDLQFLNSSGITTLLQFAIKVRDLKASQLVVLGSSDHSWQPKSLKNIQRFVKGTTLRF